MAMEKSFNGKLSAVNPHVKLDVASATKPRRTTLLNNLSRVLFVCACGFGLCANATTSSYVLSPSQTSYEHLVRGGSSSVEPLVNSYTVQVPDGYRAKVSLRKVPDRSRLVNCESASVSYLVDGVAKSVSSTNTFTRTGTISLSATASNPSVSWTEMYVDYYMTIAGVQTPHYAHRYHYYETYYYDYCYVITAQYICPVTVSFNSNGGDAVADRSYWSGDAYGTLPTPTRSGYKFVGWYSNAALTASVTASSTVSDSVTTLYAKWAERRSISFDTTGGNALSPQTYVVGETYGTLPTPIRSGYKFVGWYSNAALTASVTASSTVSDSVTMLYAKWAELVTVSFVTNGGSEIDPIDYVIGDKYGTLPTPTLIAHSFQGWYSDSALTTHIDSTSAASASVTSLFAKWTENHPSFSINSKGTLTSVSLNGCVNIVIPDNVKSIGDSAFSSCTSMISVYIPDSVTNIGYYAFKGCTSLNAVRIPDSVKEIGYQAFDSCGAAYDTTTIRGVRLLDGWAVGYESSLSGKVDLSGVRGIARSAFSGCAGITSVYVPDVPMGEQCFRNCTSLAEVTFDEELKEIAECMFYLCSKLSKVTLPKHLTGISSLAFDGCSSLSNIAIPSSVTNIGIRAFAETSLRSFVIPENVLKIGNNVFSKCSTLTSISIYANNLECGQDMFWLYPNAALSSVYVYGENWPTGSIGAFSMVSSSCRVYARRLLSSKAKPDTWTNYSLTFQYLAGESVTLTFDSKGGSEVEPRTCTEGNAYGTLPTPTRIGYVFGGWKNKNGAIVKTSDVISPFDTVLTATWTPTTYSISLDRQDGSGSTSLATATYGEEMPAIAVPLRMGYAFGGYWSETNGGGEQYYTNDGTGTRKWTETDGRTLYALWMEKEWGTAEYLNCAIGLPFASAGDADWVSDTATSHDGIGSMRSGAIGAAAEGGRTQSVLTTTVLGEGQGSFWWKVSCEEPYYSEYYDYAVFMVDGEEVARIAGDVDWAQVSYTLTGNTEHVLTWMFTRDDFDETNAPYDNCVWVDEFVWTPNAVAVTLDSNGASEGDAQKVIVRYAGYAMALPGEGAYAKTMCRLVGWTDGERTYEVGEVYEFGFADVTLTAIWQELSWTLAEAVGVDGLVLTTGGDSEWTVDPYVFKDDMVSLRSGHISHSQETWLETTVTGPGDLTFWWKVMGEANRSRLYDYVNVSVDGVVIYKEGVSDWTNLTVAVTGGGPHVVRWTYLKNASVDADGDCAWIDSVVWTPSGGAGLAAWLAERNLTADAQAANGRTAAECYALGLDPTLATNDFRIVSIELVDGTPKVEWEPKTNRWTGAEIKATLKGAAELKGPWAEVPAGGGSPGTARPTMRFFKVTVEGQ